MRPFGARIACCILLLSAASRAASAQTQPSASSADSLEVFLVSMGPGNEVWEKFGHNALIVVDRATGIQAAYNYGIFDFNQPRFLQRFLTGDTRYWVESYPGQLLLDYYRKEDRTVVVFEAPHRLLGTLADLAAAFGPDRPVAVARELTKLFETVWRGTLGEAVAAARDGDGPEARGEQVIVIGPAPSGPAEAPADDAVQAALRAELADGVSTRDAAVAVAGRLGVSRRHAYSLATSLRREAKS